MSFSLDYIREKTAEYIREALNDGVLVAPEKDIEHDGNHPDTGRDLETPSSLKEDMDDGSGCFRRRTVTDFGCG